MKRYIILAALLIGLVGTTYSRHHFQASASLGIFYSSLSPYGEWIESDFGYAWRPVHVIHGWRPYLYGRWAWTDYGWYWISNEPFGWATFHYGRWQYDDYYGWIWIPDYDWGPAWVEWCYDNDYVGWAPLSPYATFSINIGITFSNHWITPVHYWNFVPGRYFTTTRIVDYVQPLERNRRIFGNTRGVRDIRYEDNRIINRGIDVNFIERRTNSHINRVEVYNRDRGKGERFVREGGRERIEAYRPKFEDRPRRDQSRSTDTRRENDRFNIDREQSSRRERMEQPQNHDIDREGRQRDIQGERQQKEMQQRNNLNERQQERQREQMQRWQEEQRIRDQQLRENRSRETPRPERSQPQVRERREPQTRERQQPSQRPEPQRSERENRRRP